MTHSYWQHFSYIIWWDKADFCRRVISWSSLDWSYTYEHRYDWNLIIGTTFDLVNLLNIQGLGQITSGTIKCFKLGTK